MKPQPTVNKVSTVSHWVFPLGDKLAMLRIEGSTDLNLEDMAALKQACAMFTKAVRKRQEPEKP